MEKKNKICPIHKVELVPYIAENVSRWHGEYNYNYYEDFYCPKCEEEYEKTTK